MALTVTPDGPDNRQGFHVGTLPSGQPSQITHAWGWSTTTLARVRFDPDPARQDGRRSLDLDVGSGLGFPFGDMMRSYGPADEGRTSMLIPSMLSGRELVNARRVIVNGQPFGLSP